MRLKDLLKEENRNWEKIAKKFIKSDDWVDPDPPLYRGKESKNRDPVTKRVTRSNRKPLDTRKFVQKVVNFYHKLCYPQFPDRSEVKFATTDRGWAHEFGDEIFIVLPHKKATVYHSKKDPVSELGSAGKVIQDFQADYRRWERRTRKSIGKYDWSNKKLLKKLIENFNDKSLSEELKSLGCPKKIEKELENISEREDLNNPSKVWIKRWINSLLTFYANIRLYFERLESGYPDEMNQDDEVCFKGEYVIIKEELYKKVKN